MRLQELIQNLQELKQEHGNVEVVLRTCVAYGDAKDDISYTTGFDDAACFSQEVYEMISEEMEDEI